ncbi:MAG: electron transfer flavoprotein subunit beta/FixA family protein [Anaerolineae bacterium]|nr:electron transfer flavoprotein subunit beta/FixA family protein [Anaerolineae bacterium]
MKIVVCVKQVPDTAAQIIVDDGQVSWGDAPLVINPWDEYAVEAALQQASNLGGSVTVISLGKENETEALKHALAMGCSDAILVSDPALVQADNVAAARVLATAIKKAGVDIAIFGKQAIDSDTGMLPAQVARVLGWPAVTLVAAVNQLNEESIKAERATEEGRQVVESNLPAVISIVKDFGEPRYPSFMGIRKAARAEIAVWDLAELGIDAPTAAVAWSALTSPPKGDIKTEIIEGASAKEIAEVLAEKLMSEKVLS